MDAALAFVRAVHFAAVLAAAGVALFRVLVAEPALANAAATPARDALVRMQGWIIRWSALAAGASALMWLWLQAASMSGRPMGALDAGALHTVLGDTQFGLLWSARLPLIIALILWPRVSPLALAAGIALAASLAWMGHAAATPGWGGALHVAADALHLIAAAAWLGGLLPLIWTFTRTLRTQATGWLALARAATPRFSVVGIVAVATLALTGLVNAWFLVGTMPGLIGTRYGLLLSLKFALFAAMIALAAQNRRRWTPVLRANTAVTSRAAVVRLWRNAMTESALGLAVVAVVGWLGIDVPAAHDDPFWPLPFRLSLAAASAPLMTVLLLLVFGVALAGGILAIAGRRGPGGALLILAIVGGIYAAAEPAFPTSYRRSPLPYAVAPVAAGAVLYRAHCATCHGENGRGDGPAAAGLTPPPSDLTTHLDAHSNGDLYWWITHGIAATGMAGFGDRLEAIDRWRLVAYLRAQAAAAQKLRPVPDTASGSEAPDFTFERDDGQTRRLSDLRGRMVLLVLYALPASAPRLTQLETARATIEANGAVVVAIAMDSARFAGAIDATPEPDAVAVYRKFGCENADGCTHVEFLLDASGTMRARWRPGEQPDWGSFSALFRAMARIAQDTASPSEGGHAH